MKERFNVFIENNILSILEVMMALLKNGEGKLMAQSKIANFSLILEQLLQIEKLLVSQTNNLEF
jgi:hypothetical protein